MKLTKEIKKQILEGFIEVFTRFASEEFQRRTWIKGGGPECDSFDDAFCDFFDQGDPILENYKDFGITEVQYQLLVKFRETLDDFPARHDLPQTFISSPEWQRIMEMAREILKAFNHPSK